MNPLKVAQIGAGNFGAHRRATLRRTGLYQLIGAYDWNTEALAAAEREDGAQPCGSLEELLDLPDLEAVFICSGAKFHTEQALAALQRGLPVFIEKPLCSTPEEMNALLAAQRETGLVVGVGHTVHAQAASSRQIKSLLASGELGTIASVEMTTAHNGGLGIAPGDWRGDPEKNPGGMLFQCGVHALHELMFLFGPPSHIAAIMRFDVHTTGTADVALCHLRWPSGLLGTLNAYHVTPYRHALSIFGTNSSLYRLEGPDLPGNVELLQQVTHRDARPEPKNQLEINHDGLIPDTDIISFYHAVREGGQAHPSLLDGARAVALVFAAEEAAKSGCIMDVAARYPAVFAG